MQIVLHARDLTHADVNSDLAWSGGPLHLQAVSAALDRRATGEIDYLAACGPNDIPIGIGGIDYTRSAGAGALVQLAVVPALQSGGIGTFLIGAAEERIRARSLARAELSVEEDNLRARALYERLGYEAFGTELDSWEDQTPDGRPFIYQATCVRMGKQLEGRP